MSPRHRVHAGRIILFLVLIVGAPDPASSLVRFDFEQAYYVHPGVQTWDFCVVRADSLYHIYYHGIPVDRPGATHADTIYHAASPDLRHWGPAAPVVTSGSGAWDTTAVWAPDVVFDEVAGRWVMAYTGVDARRNQRIGLAYSSDLAAWTPEPANPVVEPDPLVYLWHPDSSWSDFRDPFVFRQDGQWHLLASAAQWLGRRTGVLWHGVSDDLLAWQDVGPFFVNDGPEPQRIIESAQYHVLEGAHHLLFGEFDTRGVSHVFGDDPAGLSMAGRQLINGGYAPELKEFDAGRRILGRIEPSVDLEPGLLRYTVRFDTVTVAADSTLALVQPHPLHRNWEDLAGLSTVGAPTFGDNPLWRGEPTSGMVGNSYFSSKEYYQGPLSGFGYPGYQLGDGSTGQLDSRPFTVTGDRMDLLVGGGNDPESLYVALVDAATDSVLRLETGRDVGTMDTRAWDLTELAGRTCRIRIVDTSSAPGGYIAVDEIVESVTVSVAGTGEPAPPARTTALAVPNPANPRTEFRFRLEAAATVRVDVFDARGRRVWTDGPRPLGTGEQRVVWSGLDRQGRPVAAGVYLYGLTVDGIATMRGKVAIVR